MIYVKINLDDDLFHQLNPDDTADGLTLDEWKEALARITLEHHAPANGNDLINNVGKSQSCMVSKLRIILPGDATNRSALDPAVFAEQLEEMLLLVLPTEKDGLEEHPDQEGSDEEDPREAEIRVRFHIIGHARISM